MDERKQGLKNKKIQNLSLIIHNQLMMSMKNWKTKKRKGLIVFDDMIADLEANEKLNSIVTELFLRVRKFKTA